MLAKKQFILILSISISIVILASLTIFANHKSPISVKGNGGVVEVTIEPPYPANTVKNITVYAKENTKFHKTRWQKISYIRAKGQKHYTFYWNTLKCHNNRYTIRANIQLTDRNVTITKAVKITNLVISQCVPDNVIAYNGDPETACIYFKVDDNDTSDPMYAVIYIYSLENHYTPVRKIKRKIPLDGQCTVYWDCRDSRGREVDPDPYTYDIKIHQKDTAEYVGKKYTVNDHCTYRSPYLQIKLGPSHSFFWFDHGDSDNGTRLIEYDDYWLHSIDYTLVDTKNTYASGGKIHLYDDYLADTIQYDLKKSQCRRHDSTDCCIATKKGAFHEPYFEVPDNFIDSGGPYFTSLEIFDGHAAEYRDHKPKRALNY